MRALPLCIGTLALAATIVGAPASASSQPVLGEPSTPAITAQAGGVVGQVTIRVTAAGGNADGIEMTADLRPLGGAMRAPFVDRGLVCEDDTRDGLFFSCFRIPLNAVVGVHAITVTAEDPQGRTDTVTLTLTVTPPTDVDADGLPDVWELTYGFDPAVPGEPALDADGDGVSNLDEFRAGSHPRGTATRYFAEGVSNAFFRTRLALFNPSASPASVVVRMQASDGAQTSLTQLLAGFAPSTIALHNDSPGNDYSIVVESDRLVVADRTVDWMRARNPESSGFVTAVSEPSTFGSHAESGLPGPSMTWYLAEGATHGGFDVFYLLQNPGSVAASVTIEFLRPSPLPPLVRTYTVLPRARRTVYVDVEDPGLAATDVSASVTASVPIVVERAMYYSTAARPFAAGHAGAGAPAASLTWYLAEGATGYFDAYILLANPNAAAATVSLTYLTQSGPVARTFTVAGRSRLTVNPNLDVALSNSSFGAAITATAPIVVERAMWWPASTYGEGPWREAHLVGASTAAATRWAIASLPSSISSYSLRLPAQVQSFVLVANPSPTPATLTLTDGLRSTTMTVGGQSRITIPAAYLAGVLSGNPDITVLPTGLIVESSGPPIVVERATYADATASWETGTAVLGTPIP